MPTDQNSTNLTVNGQFYNGLPDGILDEIQKRFLVWIKNKLNTAYELVAGFVMDHIITIIIIALVMCCFPYVFLMIIRTMIGYTVEGIAKGSMAAFHMSLYGGHVAAGSLVSLLQSVGVLGFAMLSKLN
ncbi:5198_t:CDS:2 [Paraglomus brasilianum]|uniref:5198_t:CDS:1 n=1 Tax=Paraglomus brasilianum TaxID=144538 RepID=A0A9N9C6R5_9GLOM|nr:5198_t:CDS:2 [Paraglomus brasilianum]